MKKTTRILALALALVMALGLLPITAGAVTVTEIAPPKYDEVKNFTDGIAAVKQDGKWGFIDTTGKEVVPCKYENNSAPEFHEGLAAVKVDTGEEDGSHNSIYICGFIDKTGKEVVPCQYRDVQNFSEGLAAVKGDSGEKDRWDDTIYKWGFIDTSGKEAVPCKYRKVGDFSEGLAAVADENWKWGFIDKTGKEVIPCTLEYDRVNDFHEGLAAVGNNRSNNTCTWGFIDKTGKEIVPCKYENFYHAPEFHNGLAAVELDGKWGFIDTTGKEVIPCQYGDGDYDVPEFHEGLAVVKGSTGKIKNGKTVYAPGVIDTKGNVVVPFGKYDKIEQFSEGLAAVKLVSEWGSIKWGFIDTTGKEVVPCEYEEIGGFSEGLAAVRVFDADDRAYKWGFVDATGREVVPCTLEYRDVESLSQGLAAVWGDSGKKNEWGSAIYKFGFIDKTGAEVAPCKYDPVENFSEGLAKVRTSNGWGHIDLHGNEVIPCQYGEVKLLSAGMVAVQLDKKWGIFRVEDLPTEPKPAPAPTPTPEPTTPNTYTAKATNDKLTVDGVSKAPTAYKINNANYFQLRDVAVLLNSTKAQFSVEYDNATKAIKITTGQPYAPNGKEMKGAKATAEAIVGNNDVYINGVKTDFKVYKISGSNFFQIRDLGKALGFHVDWAKDVGIIIDPSKPYSGK